ncbi:MAG: phosphatidylglycerophosphatase A [bacterium]
MIFNIINKLYTRAFFIGNIPGAPGTWGTLFAIILLWNLSDIFSNFSIILILLFLGVLTTGYEENHITHIHDDGRIVIDEIVGLFVTFIGIPLKPWLIITGFILFRFFDILKPLGINQVQKLSGGWGVMADDFLAGVFANILLQISLRIIG